MFKLEVGRSPRDGQGLASQTTLSRLENGVGPRELYRMAEMLVDVFIESHRGDRVKRIVLDAVGEHGREQQAPVRRGWFVSRCGNCR